MLSQIASINLVLTVLLFVRFYFTFLDNAPDLNMILHYYIFTYLNLTICVFIYKFISRSYRQKIQYFKNICEGGYLFSSIQKV